MLKYVIGWELARKKAPILWEKYDYRFPRFSPYDGLLHSSVKWKVDGKIHGFPIWWDSLIFSCVSCSSGWNKRWYVIKPVNIQSRLPRMLKRTHGDMEVSIYPKPYMYLFSYTTETAIFIATKHENKNYASQHFNVRSTLWINVEITLIRHWKWKKIQRWIYHIAQRWYNIETTLTLLYLDVVSTCPQQ